MPAVEIVHTVEVPCSVLKSLTGHCLTVFVTCGKITVAQWLGDLAAVVGSRMNGLIPFERTIEPTTETIPPSSK